jgi:hypothetical protein
MPVFIHPSGARNMFNILGLLVLAADIYAIINIIQSKAKTGTQVLWVLLVVVFPFVGMVFWCFMGPKKQN